VEFKLDVSGNDTVLHSFSSRADGAGPVTGLVHYAAGHLYGVTQCGGTSGFGVVFNL